MKTADEWKALYDEAIACCNTQDVTIAMMAGFLIEWERFGRLVIHSPMFKKLTEDTERLLKAELTEDDTKRLLKVAITRLREIDKSL